jgi:hypothetical protein
MNTQAQKQQAYPVEISANSNQDFFNFELWANEVRRQMIASLQKKSAEREARSNGKKLK